MQFDWWTFGFQIVNVAILTWLLSRFMFRPIADMIKTRRDETARALQDAEDAQSRAAKAEEQAGLERKKNEADRLALLDAARTQAEVLEKGIVEKAHETANEIVAAANVAERAKADDNRKQQVRTAGFLAVKMTRRLLENLPQDARISGYPKRLQDLLRDADADQLDALKRDAKTLQIVVPRTLSDSEMKAATKAVRNGLGPEAQAEITIDETLLAGLELKNRHCVIHNSLRHDLEVISEAMKQHDQS
tara:strand:+ start:3471 stop:4214 length:744 start_codon:yes stop_codon:yes gene_type:complete